MSVSGGLTEYAVFDDRQSEKERGSDSESESERERESGLDNDEDDDGLEKTDDVRKGELERPELQESQENKKPLRVMNRIVTKIKRRLTPKETKQREIEPDKDCLSENNRKKDLVANEDVDLINVPKTIACAALIHRVTKTNASNPEGQVSQYVNATIQRSARRRTKLSESLSNADDEDRAKTDVFSKRVEASLKMLAWTKVTEMLKLNIKTGKSMTNTCEEDSPKKHTIQGVVTNTPRPTWSENVWLEAEEGEANEKSSSVARWNGKGPPEKSQELPGRRDSLGIADQVLKDLVEINAKCAKTRTDLNRKNCERTVFQTARQQSKDRNLQEVMNLEVNTPHFELRNEEIAISQKRNRRMLSTDRDTEGVSERSKDRTSQRASTTPKHLSKSLQGAGSSESEDEGKLTTVLTDNHPSESPVEQKELEIRHVLSLSVETIVAKISPLLMSSTTIAVAPLVKLYENLNESLKDQTTLMALLNSKIVKLEMDLIEMTAQVRATRKGNDITLTALRESLKNTAEDKRLLAEVAKQALVLLQREHLDRRSPTALGVFQKPHLNEVHVTGRCHASTSTVTGDSNKITKVVNQEPKRTQNCCSNVVVDITTEICDCPVKSPENKEIRKKNRGNTDATEDVSIKKGKANDKKDIEAIEDTPTKEKEKTDEIFTGIEMSTLENEKKTEAEWFDIFEKDKRKERPEKNLQKKSANAKVNTSKNKTKNQQKQKLQNPKSSTNFFRNIKALNITVNNPESMVSKNKKGVHGVIEEVEKQKPERQSTSSKSPAKLKVIEKNSTSVERIIDEEVEEEADDEELINLSTYSAQDVDEQEDESSDENTQQKAVKEQNTNKEIQIGNKEAGFKRCFPPKDMVLRKRS
ncbi:enolase-phosphatase E1-like [Ambystoma mexicanum]|uniref:enolase-phosphatase E1-like n=1 Tax=Ambystoma mexicanum TaxID=8296 RepID=UPI0037E76B46